MYRQQWQTFHYNKNDLLKIRRPLQPNGDVCFGRVLTGGGAT